MGIEYSYNLVVGNEEKKKLFSFINERGVVDRFNNCTFNVDIDSFILKYLEGGYGSSPKYDKEYINKYIKSDNMVEIKGIDLIEKRISDNKVLISFIAVTDEMSMLFKESINLKNFFKTLSKNVGATITFIDMDLSGYEIILYKNMDVNIYLGTNGDEEIKENEFVEIMKEFSSNISKAFYQ